ncbi:orphan G-protein coupled receptor 40 [Sarcoptes scabiei]|nr:orphan G-protein coupled receptor 40 [Sarcoptes scabiei]
MRLLLENGGNCFLETNESGWTPLFYACSRGHAETIRMLLNQNARVDIFDERGQAALHIASEIGQEEVVEILLESNAFVNVRNKNGMTPLHLAARRGYNNMVRRLITEHSALLDANTLTKQTPLHLAAEAGQFAVCETLLNLKADALAVDNHSQTPLHLAAEHDHSEVVKLFLKHKPDLLQVHNKNGYTCAHIAAAKGSVAVIKELMRLNQESVINARISKTKSTTLHLAAEGGHVHVVRELLRAGAKATDENIEGYTALHLAAKKGHVNVLRALKEQSTAYWKVCSRRIGLTALHVAAAFGQTECVSEMLPIVPATIKSERPLIDPSGDYGITPLHLAAQSGHENVVRLLLNSKGVQVAAPTEVAGTIPMHLAAQGGHLLVAGLLISRTSDQLHRADKYGRTPLHLAASFGHRDMVSLLLGQGANINSQDNRGWSPLHYAARHGFLEVVQLLVDSGADPGLVSKEGRVPICCAAGAGHYQVLSYLFKKDHDTLSLMEDRDFLLDLMVCSKQNENKPIQEFILVSAAPIDTAVKLAKSYENLAQKEKDRTRDLEAVCRYCDQIATDLLSIAATTNNAGRLLRAVDYKQTEFLDVLIELERKEVVAQHAVQQYLTNVWIGNMKWAGWKFILLFFTMLFCPLIWVLISCPFGHRLSKMPIIKFMLYLVSHIFFIVILTITTVNPWLPIYMNDGQWPYWHEWLLAIWVLGIFLAELTNPADRDGLGGIKVVVVFVCFLALLMHVLTVITGYFEYFEEVTRFVMLYLRNQLLAVALLLSFLEFLNFLTFHHLFGPWAVIIRDLIKDLLRFLAILLIFMIGFSLHICAIYQPVFEPPDTINGTLPSYGQEFQNPIDTFEMLFFALFGLVEPDYMPPMHLSPPVAKIIMKLVFGVYMMVTVIVLINLLIAMMSNTYQRIQAQSDTEWKFGRAKLIRNMTLTSPTPSPINIFIGLPYKMLQKLITYRKNRKSRMHITAALAHRPSVMATQKWLQGGVQGATASGAAFGIGRRASRATSHISRTLGHTYADDGEAQKPITEVINWASIVKKYLEYIGAIGAGDDGEEEKDEGALLLDSPVNTTRPLS